MKDIEDLKKDLKNDDIAKDPKGTITFVWKDGSKKTTIKAGNEYISSFVGGHGTDERQGAKKVWPMGGEESDGGSKYDGKDVKKTGSENAFALGRMPEEDRKALSEDIDLQTIIDRLMNGELSRTDITFGK